jgi:hypothetical protein
MATRKYRETGRGQDEICPLKTHPHDLLPPTRLPPSPNSLFKI